MNVINIPATWCGVYHVIRDDEVIYVGQTINVFSRIGNWRSGKFTDEHFDRVEFFPVAIDDLNEVEERHIRDLKPLLNVEGVTRRYREPIRCTSGPRWWCERRAVKRAKAARERLDENAA